MQKLFFNQTILNPNATKSNCVIFFGAGNACAGALYDALLYHNIKPDFICDSDESKVGTSISDIEVISLVRLFEFARDVLIVISVYSKSAAAEICNMLRKNGFENVFLYGVASFWEQWFYSDICKKHTLLATKDAEKIKSVYDILYDNKSKEIYEKLLAMRSGENFDVFAQICTDDEYFAEDIISLTQEETFIDAGAYRGETAILFAQKTRFQYRKIYSFEPAAQNIKHFKHNTKNFRNIKLFPYALYDSCSKQKLEVENLATDSFNISENGDIDIDTVTLDSVLLTDEITFIKMDIEGAEVKALDGARNILQEYVPKLAIAAYHRPEDVWEIPLKIHEVNPGYKIYLRHHSEIHSGTVCYAVI